MSMFEKVCILGSLGAVGAFSVWSIFAPSKGSLKKEQVQAKREELLKDENMRILYSTMTFFYLQGFQQEQMHSFHNLYDVLNISRPKLVALQLSQKEYDEKYQPIISHPQYPELMRKVDFYLQTKSDELSSMKELDLKHLEKLYIFDYCKKNKCKVLFGDKSPAELRGMYQAKLQLSQFHIDDDKSVPTQLKDLYSEDLKKFETIQKTKVADKADKKEQDKNKEAKRIALENQIKKEIYQDFRYNYYVDIIMEELQPKTTFMPSSPYKTLVGLVEPEDLEGVSTLWKNKFRATYGHEIIEDEEVVAKRENKLSQQQASPPAIK